MPHTSSPDFVAMGCFKVRGIDLAKFVGGGCLRELESVGCNKIRMIIMMCVCVCVCWQSTEESRVLSGLLGEIFRE